MKEETVSTTLRMPKRLDAALLKVAGERQIATGKQVYKADIVKEAVACYLVAHEDSEDIEAILTDYGTDRETYDGAVARLKALQCKESLDTLGGWINAS